MPLIEAEINLKKNFLLQSGFNYGILKCLQFKTCKFLLDRIISRTILLNYKILSVIIKEGSFIL